MRDRVLRILRILLSHNLLLLAQMLKSIMFVPEYVLLVSYD